MPLAIGIFIGLLTGLVTGFSGTSGVIVVIPLVTLLVGLPIHEAIGTSLLADVLTTIPVAFAYWRHGNVHVRKSLILLVGALLGAQLGAHKAGAIPATLLAAALVAFLIVMGIVMWRKGLPKTRMEDAHGHFEGKYSKFLARPIVVIAIGFLLGLMTGFFGAGGGLLAFLVLYFVLRMSLRAAIGTSTAFMVFTAFSGMLGYVGQGTIDVKLGILIGVGGIIGGVVASYMAHKISEKHLAKVIGGLFIILGVGMLLLRVFS